jgi:hypothetical protein
MFGGRQAPARSGRDPLPAPGYWGATGLDRADTAAKGKDFAERARGAVQRSSQANCCFAAMFMNWPVVGLYTKYSPEERDDRLRSRFLA